MSKRKIRGGIVTNLDIKSSKEQLAQQGKDEWNTHVVDETINETEDYKYLGNFAPGRDNTITNTMDSWSLSDVLKRKAENRPIIPVWSYTNSEGEVCWILTDEDELAVQSGYVCESCLCWQAVPSAARCNYPNGNSCGYEPQRF